MSVQRSQIWLSALVGVVVFLVPWLLSGASSTVAAPLSDAANWNLWVAGLIIVGLSLAALADFRAWQELGSTIVGGWLLASPWIFDFTAASAMAWTVGIGGALLVVLGLWSLASYYGSRPYAA